MFNPLQFKCFPPLFFCPFTFTRSNMAIAINFPKWLSVSSIWDSSIWDSLNLMGNFFFSFLKIAIPAHEYFLSRSQAGNSLTCALSTALSKFPYFSRGLVRLGGWSLLTVLCLCYLHKMEISMFNHSKSPELGKLKVNSSIVKTSVIYHYFSCHYRLSPLSGVSP